MNGLEALKRIRQETAPNTYCEDFNKEECCNTIEEKLNKLGEYEDIEEELGLELTTLFKALTQGVYAKYTVVWEPETKKEIGKFSVCLVRNLFGLKGWFIMAGHKEPDFWELNEYGKTWALTREELEKWTEHKR